MTGENYNGHGDEVETTLGYSNFMQRFLPTRTFQLFKFGLYELLVMVTVLLMAGCTSGPPVSVGSGAAKVERACLEINESMNHELTPAEVTWCERNLAIWYDESRFSRADPADQYEGDAQLSYFRQQMAGCKRAADRYEQRGLDRRNMLMRCLVITRR